MKSVVLLSSGLDSTVNLYEARRISDVVLAITFDYNQRAAAQEIAHARAICGQLGVTHKVLALPWFSEFTKTSLVARQAQVPTAEEVSIDDMVASKASAERVWVPNRNGIFLNIAAGFAEGLGADFIVPGFNLEEAQTFPDNSQAYLEAQTHAFYFSTANHVEVRCLTTSLNKTEIVRRGMELGVDFKNVWPCYFAEARPCGVCESCQRFARAARSAGLQ